MKQSQKWLSRILACVAVAVIASILLLRRGNLTWYVEVALYGLLVGLLGPLLQAIPGAREVLADRDIASWGKRIALAAIVLGLLALVAAYVTS